MSHQFRDEDRGFTPDRESFDGEASDDRQPLEPLLLTASDAAYMLCISPKTLGELVKRDRLPCVEFVATGFRRPIRRYRLQDMITFIDEAVA